MLEPETGPTVMLSLFRYAQVRCLYETGADLGTPRRLRRSCVGPAEAAAGSGLVTLGTGDGRKLKTMDPTRDRPQSHCPGERRRSAKIAPDSALVGDLGIDSPTALQMLMKLEDRLEIESTTSWSPSSTPSPTSCDDRPPS